MSMRDPMEELADLVLYHLDDWWAEVRAMEPSPGGSLVTLPATRGMTGSVVESFVLRHDAALRALRALHATVRRFPAHLREIYRLRYRDSLTRDEVSVKARCELRTVDRRLAIIRGRVAAAFRSMSEGDRAEFERVTRSMPALAEPPRRVRFAPGKRGENRARD